MVRLARVEALDQPHHVIQRGNRRQNVFFSDQDKAEYLRILELQSALFRLDIWAYCLMDNHIHLIVVPKKKNSLTESIAETHRLYTRMVNFREGWRGYLWQGRFKSFPLDEGYLWAAIRYVERNPLRARIVKNAEDYPWSSAKAHAQKINDPLLKPFYLLDEIPDWSKYLASEEEEKHLKLFRRHGQTGRPLGDGRFIRRLEGELGRILGLRKPGPKR